MLSHTAGVTEDAVSLQPDEAEPQLTTRFEAQSRLLLQRSTALSTDALGDVGTGRFLIFRSSSIALKRCRSVSTDPPPNSLGRTYTNQSRTNPVEPFLLATSNFYAGCMGVIVELFNRETLLITGVRTR